MSCLIKLSNITKTYQKGEIKTTVLNNVSLEVESQDLLAIVGSSGSGKSSLLNILGLLDKQTTGDYYLKGKSILHFTPGQLARIRNREIGFIFQSFFLLPRLTIKQNVGLPLTYREWDEEKITHAALEALERVSLAHLSERYPNELSGGQQQRVAIARALVTKPSVILADEPTGALDSKMSQEIMNLFIQLNTLDKNTLIIITHDPKIAAQCFRHISIQDGQILADKKQ